MASWIALHPQWFLHELKLLHKHHPHLRVDERRLDSGILLLSGELRVRAPGGTKVHSIVVLYPDGTPFEHPMIFPIKQVINEGPDRPPKFEWEFFDRRHQMPLGNLCLFQRETRATPGGDVLDITQVLRRAQQWFMGLHTGRWPPDTGESELEAHFVHGSDVLVAECFYDDALRGRGRFYMIPDLRRLVDASPDYTDGCPMIVTAMTIESGIIRVLDARNGLSDIYPWITADEWDPYKMAALPNGNSGQLRQPEQGYWWTLPAEPQPFRDGQGLLRALATVGAADAWDLVSAALGGSFYTADRFYFGLQYPARYGGVEWLFVVLPHTVRRVGGGVLLNADAKRQQFERLPTYCLRAHSLRKEDLWRRNQSAVAPSIKEKSVAIIGLGALGSQVAVLLAQAGVSHFRLCDSDRLKPANVTRHIGGISDFGAAKVRVIMSRLLNINPRLRFAEGEAIAENAVKSLDQLSAFLSHVDLIISATADENVESVVNQVAAILGMPALYCRALRRGAVGRVFLVRPGRDACKACLAGYAHARHEGKPIPTDWIDVTEEPDDVLIHECGRPVIAGSAADLSFTASLTARVAIDFLEGRSGAANHWIWTRGAVPELDPRLNGAFSALSGTLPPCNACPVCREPPIVELVLDEDARQRIISEVTTSPGVETGGVLAGFVDTARRAIVTRVIGPGPKAVKSATRFDRDVEYAQAELDQVARECGEKGSYIGEWHSHLEPSPEPSPTDVRSLSGIAAAPHYLTSNPALLIAGFDPRAGRVVTLRSWVFMLSGRFHRIPNAYDSSVAATAASLL